MALPGVLMASSAIIQGISSIFGANAEADAIRKKASYNATISEFNAKISDMNAEDAVRRGETDAQTVLKRGRKVQGSQRVALAAQGIEVDSGSAADIQEETEVLSALDARTVRSNALREAFGFKVQAMQSRMDAKFGVEAGENASRGTLLTGALGAIGAGAQAGYYWNRKDN
jgi:hypothetical protein